MKGGGVCLLAAGVAVLVVLLVSYVPHSPQGITGWLGVIGSAIRGVLHLP